MRSCPTFLLAGLLVLTSACSTTPVEEDQVAALDDEVICKTQRELGSTFKRRVCMTAAEWRAAREASKEIALTRRPDFNAPGQAGSVGRE